MPLPTTTVTGPNSLVRNGLLDIDPGAKVIKKALKVLRIDFGAPALWQKRGLIETSLNNVI